MKKMYQKHYLFLCLILHISAAFFYPAYSGQNDNFDIVEKGNYTSILDSAKPDSSKSGTLSKDIKTSITLTKFAADYIGKKSEWKTFPNGILYKDILKGKGKSPEKGIGVYLHIKSFLDNGEKLDDTFKSREFYSFTFRNDPSLKNFEDAIADMKKGSKRKLIVPSYLIFGPTEIEYKGKKIKPDSCLIFEVNLIFMVEPEWDKIKMFK